MIKAILFDTVGVPVFKKKSYLPNILNDIKEKLKLSDEEIEIAVRLISEKYEKIDLGILNKLRYFLDIYE